MNTIENPQEHWSNVAASVLLGRKIVAVRYLDKEEAIRRAALDRSEMKRVAIVGTMPRERAGVLYSVKTFDDMLGPWREYYAPEPVGGAT